MKTRLWRLAISSLALVGSLSARAGADGTEARADGGGSPAPDAVRTTLDPLVQVSGASPFAACTADFVALQPGTVYIGSEIEPWLAVNPRNPRNVVATWQQDRWSNGGARGIAVGASFDGGLTWQTVPVPGLTRCTGGPFFRASDPWLDFAPNGDLHLIALGLQGGPGRASAILSSTSTDGGLTWDDPRQIAGADDPLFHDKEAITADPTDPDLVYAVWDRLDFLQDVGPAVFSRSTDGGRTWEPERVIHDPGPHGQTIGNQLLVLPGGRLVDFFTEISFADGLFLSLKTSDDKGLTWGPAGGAFRVQRMLPFPSYDPEILRLIRDGVFLFDVAVDPRSGSLYAVWQDGRFTGFQASAVAFTMSADEGRTWSEPVAVNRAPADLDPLRRQAFLPSVHVSGSGAVGITYYDLRFNDAGPGLPADHWFIWCHPRAADCSNPARWREEIRLTDASFDVESAPIVTDAFFLGDYMGLASAGDDFAGLFMQSHAGPSAGGYFRRIVQEFALDPGDDGYWRRQVRAALDGKGRQEETGEALAASLADIQVLYDLFDDVQGLPGLLSILEEKGHPKAREALRREVLALLLNLTRLRIPPYALVRGEETLVGVIDDLIGILQSPAASKKDLEQARHVAEQLNHGHIPVR